MKKLLLLFILGFTSLLHAQTAKNLYEQLVNVNEQWKNQPDVDASLKLLPAKQFTEQQLVQFHLQQTELLLRKRDVAHLSVSLKRQRQENLNILHSYWQNGIFPVNDMHLNRQPYFIDKYNTYCAVGYLMKQTGGDAIAKQIHDTQNFSYLLDINHPQLMHWAAQSGLTLGELALIQPGYYANWPSSLLEMHYNNTGVDVNEYIEIHQSSNTGFGGFASKLLFYDENNNLYKTLLLTQMQSNFDMYSGQTYYYTFPTNENFADIGRVEIWNESNQISSIISYTDAQVKVQDNFPTNSIPIVREYAIGEGEATAIGTSLTFCGYYYNSWNPQIKNATIGVVSSCTITPISLSKFEYALKDKSIVLSWETVSEVNSSYFVVERSKDGSQFETLTKIIAGGNTTGTKQYSFTDERPAYTNHYRLKQVDIDGKSTYSKILFVKVTKANPLNIVENPVRKKLNVQISLDNDKIASLTIFDFAGKKVKAFSSKSNYQVLDVSDIYSGKYLLQLITTDGRLYSQQFIKIK